MTLSDRILFIDGEALVLDKPAGLPVDTPRAGGDSVERRLPELACGFRRPPSPMHRLDRDTSGCLLLARNLKGRQRFAKAFENGLVGKSYLAVVGTEIAGEEGMIDLPLAKISTVETGWRMVVDEKGKTARTRWRRIAVADGQSLVEFRPETGRTHQIRVHMAAQRHPCLGDAMYGADPQISSRLELERQWLHAMRLGFRHPSTGDTVSFESVYPADLQHALDVLRDR